METSQIKSAIKLKKSQGSTDSKELLDDKTHMLMKKKNHSK